MIELLASLLMSATPEELSANGGRSALVSADHVHRWLLIDAEGNNGNADEVVMLDRAFNGLAEIDGTNFATVLLRFIEDRDDTSYVFEFETAIDCERTTFAYTTGWSPSEAPREPQEVPAVEFRSANIIPMLARMAVFKQACGVDWKDNEWEALLAQ